MKKEMKDMTDAEIDALFSAEYIETNQYQSLEREKRISLLITGLRGRPYKFIDPIEMMLYSSKYFLEYEIALELIKRGVLKSCEAGGYLIDRIREEKFLTFIPKDLN